MRDVPENDADDGAGQHNLKPVALSLSEVLQERYDESEKQANGKTESQQFRQRVHLAGNKAENKSR